jgi:hypothetical protein
VSFLNPFALLAMAAVAVPLFLHLFNLRQPQTVDFSSLAFVQELQETAVQRVRIKEWLLLALRMLAIACLVLAFAQPTLTGELGGVAGRTVRTAHALVVDNSLSMQVGSEEGGTALDRAKARARGVLRTVDAGDEVVVWPTARRGEQAPSLSTNPGVAEDALSALAPRAGAASLARSVAAAAEAVAASDAPRRVVYVAGEFQRSTLGDSLSRQLSVPDGVEVRLLPVGTRAAANVGVSDVSVVSRIAEVGEPVQIEATLVNYGDAPLPDYVASVYLDDERVAQTTTTLEPGLQRTVSFTVTPQRRGWLRGAVATTSDDFPPDDRHHFTLHVPEERRVLVVQGTGQETRYVDLALSSEMTADRIAFQRTAIEESALASAELGQYDTVLLVGPRSLSSGAVDALTRYVERGGGVLLFPSEQATPQTYDGLLQALGAGRVQGFSGSPAGEESVASFDRVDLEHPLFEGVFSRERRPDAEIEQPRIYYAANLRPSGRSGQTLIELTSGVPFLHEVRAGSGALLWMAVAPTPRWSDLPVRGLFVPLLYRSVYYLSAGASVAGEQLVAGAPGELRISGLPPGTSLRLVGPEGTEVAPDQRSLFGATLLRVGRTLDRPGVYDVQAGETLVRRVAVNVDPAESDLRVAPADSAAARLQAVLRAPVQPVEGSGAAEVAETLRTQQAGTEIWNVFLLLALAFLVAEMVVARVWRPETTAA